MNARSTEFRRDRHIRRIRLLKVALPLVALAIISSLFLFSRSITMQGALPIADVDIKDRMREPKMTKVDIATTNDAGATIEIIADAVVPIGTDKARAISADGKITSVTGEVTTLTATLLTYDDSAATAELTGGVRVTSLGYVMTSDAFDIDITAASLESRGAVVAVGPLGQLDAGRMTAQQTKGGVVLVFNSGVKLVYTPD